MQGTIKAVNEAGLDYRVAQPWPREESLNIVRTQLACYVLENLQDCPPCASILDRVPIRQTINSRGRRKR